MKIIKKVTSMQFGMRSGRIAFLLLCLIGFLPAIGCSDASPDPHIVAKGIAALNWFRGRRLINSSLTMTGDKSSGYILRGFYRIKTTGDLKEFIVPVKSHCNPGASSCWGVDLKKPRQLP